MFLNSIFLGFAIFPSSFKGCQEVSNISFVFCNLCHFLFSPFPLFWSLLLPGQTCSWWHSHSLAAAGATWVGMWLESHKKNPWKTTNLTSGPFYWNLCTSISEKNHSILFTANLEFLGASNERFPKAGSWNPHTEDTYIPRIKLLTRQAQDLWFCSWFILAFLTRQNKGCFQFLATPRPSKQQKVIIYRNYANFQT